MAISLEKITEIFEELVDLYESGENVGACTACGEIAYEIEPDARQYKCESCGALKVFGVEEILMAVSMEKKHDNS